MSRKIDRAHSGDVIELVVEADGAEGRDVHFEIQTAAGEVIDAPRAIVTAGIARATWTADAHGKPLPLELVFRATCGDAHADAGTLWLDPPGMIGTPSWLLLGTGGKPGELTLLPPSAAQATKQAPEAMLPYRELSVGDELGLVTDVCAPDGSPLVGDFDVTFDLHKESPDGGFAPIKSYVRALSAPDGATVIAAKWVMDTMGLPPPYRYRFVVSWRRRPGEDRTPEDARSPLTSRSA